MARNLPMNLFRDVSDGQVDGVGRIVAEKGEPGLV
jgi:hypothetical protein